MQILGSVTARDRPRSGFKFKFPTARVPAPVTGLTFPRRSLRPVHLSPLSGRRGYLFSFERKTERERERKEDTRRSVITDDPRGRGNLYRVAEADVRKFEIENQTVKANCQGTSYRFREPWEDRDSRARALPPVPITRILISGPCPK